MIKEHRLLLLFLFFLSFILAGLLREALPQVKKLDKVSKDFYEHVQYIITQEESRIFLELPPASRLRFVEEFWLRRDPTPGTEQNEFKEAYYKRIEEANHLFRGARPGWRQDRGRFYILFGPPNERRTNPMGGRPIEATRDHRELTGGTIAATGEKASEIWTYYSLFASLQKPQTVELVFVDSDGTGDYKLATNLDQLLPGGLDSLLRPNLEFTHEIYKEEDLRSKSYLRWIIFDFEWELIKVKDKAAGSNLSIRVALPYIKTLFRAVEGHLIAALKLDIKIQDSSERTIWEHSLTDTLDIPPEMSKERRDEKWEKTTPVPMMLKKGKYSVYIRLENTSGNQSIDKLLPLKI
jgi:GWxTD domain-containing protein